MSFFDSLFDQHDLEINMLITLMLVALKDNAKAQKFKGGLLKVRNIINQLFPGE